MDIFILNIQFNVLEIDADKFLLQAVDQGEERMTSVPLLGEYIHQHFSSYVDNVVAAEDELLLYYKQGQAAKLTKKLSEIQLNHVDVKFDFFHVDVCFELGEDWDTVSEELGLGKEEIIVDLLKQDYPLINYGFQPGFMYLDGLAQHLHVARKAKPKLKLVKGSLAIGGKYLGIYGSESPGGWNIIGRTSHYIQVDGTFINLAAISQRIKLNRLDKESYLRKYKNG